MRLFAALLLLIIPISLFADERTEENYLLPTSLSVPDTFLMCSTPPMITDSVGIIYDSGGPNGNLPSWENCSVILAPSCATSISITIDSLDLGPFPNGYFRVYDGPTTISPILFNYDQSTSTPVTIVTTGDSALIWIQIVSGQTGSGYKITWTSTLNIPPQINANFSVNDTAPPLSSIIQFTDLSDTNPIEWNWDFGDGSGSSLQNPSHYFTTPGTKTVTLIASNCANTDTISQIVTVQDNPFINVAPDSFSVTLSCGDSITQQISISNSGLGELIFELDSSVVYTSDGPANILVYTANVNSFVLTNLYNTIDQHFTNYTLSQVNTIFPHILRNSLVNKDILVIPGSYITSDVAQEFSPILSSFINNGGRIVLFGRITLDFEETGLISVGTYENVPGETLIISDPIHHLSDSLPEIYIAPDIYSTYAFDSVNTDFHKVITFQDKTVLGYRNIGKGKLIISGFTYPFDSSSQVVGNIIRWASELSDITSVVPDLYSGTLSTGDTTVVNISISAQNLIAGTYNLSLEVNSNDSLQKYTPVEFTLTVTGNPELILSDTCLHFGTTQQFTHVYDTIVVINPGCDTLVFDSVYASGPQLIPEFSSFFVEPWDTVALPVSFYPDSSISFSGTLFLSNNFNDTTICFDGTGTPGAEITILPDSIIATAVCGDSVTVSFNIYNTGDLPLTYQYIGLDSADVLAFIYGVEVWDEYAKTIDAIRQTFNGFRLTSVFTANPLLVQNALIGKEVFYMAKQEVGNPNNYAPLDTVLANFINNGGDVVMHGTSSSEISRLFDTGLIDGVYADEVANSALVVSEDVHPITDALQPGITGAVSTHALYITPGTGFTTLVSDSNDFSVVAYKDEGNGKIVYNGYDYDSSNLWSTQLAGNIMKWVAEDPVAPWIHIPDTGNTISPQSFTTVTLTFSAEDLIAGIYNHVIHIATNDPHYPRYSLPCTFIVTGDPVITLSDTCLDFGNTWVGFSYSQNFQVTNTGCDSLIADNITVNAPFSVSVPNLALPAFGSATITVTCTPTIPGNYNLNLVLDNNGIDTTICVNSLVTYPPTAAISVSSINETIGCSEIIAIPVTLYNIGDAPLTIDPNDIPPPGPIRVLASGYGVDTLLEYVHTINAINTGFTNYTIFRTDTEDPGLLKSYLDTTDILLFPEFETGVPGVIAPLATVLENFVENGGNVLFCATEAEYGLPWLNTGLMTLNYGDVENNNILDITGTHPILDSIIPPFIAPNLTISLDITNPGKQSLVQESGSDIVATWPMGYGELVYAGFDYFYTNTNATRIIANSMKWLARNSLPFWFSTALNNATILPGDSITFLIYLNSDSLQGGTHTYTFTIQTNDPFNPLLEIPVTLTVSPIPCATINYDMVNCTGEVDFNCQVTNNPTSYMWYFGDGNTSTANSPQHVYANSGTYQVSLVTCNSFGCDSVSVQLNILVNDLPIAANCTPQTQSTCCDMGITEFSFANFNNTSSNATAGYEDFTCLPHIQVTEGLQYPVSITNGTAINENVVVWIDFNNDGDLTPSEEIFTGLSALVHTGQVTIPTGAVLYTPLRLRVGSENATAPMITSCTNPVEGQFEDYTIKIYPFEFPSAQFMISGIDSCNGIFQFTDLSTSAPTSWLWDFGDGNTSTSQNPIHQYSTSGIYNVTLTASNGSGSNQFSLVINVNLLQASIGISGNLIIGNPIQFSGNGNGIASWSWDFGDGSAMNTQNPFHAYSTGGVFTVSLTVVDSSGCITTVDTVISIITGVVENIKQPQLYVAPNPFTSQTELVMNLFSETEVGIQLYNTIGKIVYSLPRKRYTPGMHRISLEAPAAGIYYLKVWVGEHNRVLRILKL